MTEQPNNEQPAPALPWAKQSAESTERVTNRERRIVSSLPAWEPLPPGEIVVRRPRHQQ